LLGFRLHFFINEAGTEAGILGNALGVKFCEVGVTSLEGFLVVVDLAVGVVDFLVLGFDAVLVVIDLVVVVVMIHKSAKRTFRQWRN